MFHIRIKTPISHCTDPPSSVFTIISCLQTDHDLSGANPSDSFIQWHPPIQRCTKSISESVVKESDTLSLKGNSVLELKDHATKANGKVGLEF